MKRTVLLVASVLVAAVGTGVVALWAISTANGKQPAVAGAPTAGAVATAKPTPTAAPTTVRPDEKGLAVTLANPGLVAGQWIDLASTREGGQAEMIREHVAVLAVLADGRVLLSLSKADALDVLTRVSRGEALTALLPNPNDTGRAGTSRPGPTTSAGPTGDPTGGTSTGASRSSAGSSAGSSTQSRSATNQASSTP